jgi:hypothetical protein
MQKMRNKVLIQQNGHCHASIRTLMVQSNSVVRNFGTHNFREQEAKVGQWK